MALADDCAIASRLRILLADDHPLVADALRLALEASFEIIGVVHNGNDVIAAVRSLRPDLLILDIGLPGRSGLDIARELRQEEPALRILLLTMHANVAYVYEAWRIGVHGFATKLIDHAELVRAVQEVSEGRRYVSPDMRAKVGDGGGNQREQALSTLQCDVLRQIAGGRTARQIASSLHLSVKTVDYHRIEIRRKLGLHNNAELVQFAINIGLLG